MYILEEGINEALGYIDFGKEVNALVNNCIKQGRINEIASLIQKYDVSSEVNREGMTLLHRSAKFGTKSMTRFLIASNVPLESRNAKGETALFRATYFNNVEQVQVLLEAGADVFANDDYGEYVLCIVLRWMADGNSLFASMFIDHIKKQCLASSEQVAISLIKSGIHVSYVAFFRSDVAIAMFERGYDVNLQDRFNNFNTALHNATFIGDSDMIRTLLRFGADRNIENGSHLIPFELTHLDENLEIMLLLIPDIQSLIARYRDRPKLYRMLSRGTKCFLGLILQRYNINLTAQDADGRIPLHHLVYNPNKDVCELFQDKRLNEIDVQDLNGMTAVHHALHRVEWLRFLLDKGARLDVLDRNGLPPYFYEVDGYHNFYTPEQRQEYIDLLLLRGFDVQYTVGEESLISAYTRACINEDAENLYSVNNYWPHRHVFASFLAHIAMLELTRDVPIKPLILRHIESFDFFKSIYELAKQELEKSKEMLVFGNITLFKLLAVDNEEQIIRYARNDQIFKKVTQIIESPNSVVAYYNRYIRNRFLSAKSLLFLRNNAAKLLGPIMNIPYQNYVVEHIVSYLNIADLKLLE